MNVRWLVPFAVLAGGALALLAPTTSCATHACDGHSAFLVDSNGKPTAGDMVDRDTWESTPLGGTPWLHFGPSQTYTFRIPAFAKRTLVTTDAYVSVDSNPDQVGSAWTNGAGNIVLFGHPFSSDTDFTIDVANGTCGDYYVRIVLRAAPVDGGAPDASDGGIDDASIDVDAQ